MKKRIATLLAVGGTLSLLCVGCGTNKITADELVSGISKAYVDATSTEYEYSMNADVKLNYDGVTMDISISSDTTIQTDKNIVHAVGNSKANMLGMASTEQTELWYDGNDLYEYTDADGLWTMQEGIGMDYRISLKNMDVSAFKELILAPVTKEDTVYKVTGKLPYENLKKAIGFDSEHFSNFFDVETINMDNTYFLTAMKFDKQTKALTEITLDLQIDAESVYEEFAINSLSMTVKPVSVNKDLKLSIPDSVIENATPYVDYSEYWDEEYDVDYSTDYSEEVSATTDAEEEDFAVLEGTKEEEITVGPLQEVLAIDSFMLTITKGETGEISITSIPSAYDANDLLWVTADARVATVSGGVITGVGAGVTTVTVTTTDNEYTCACSVIVNDN